MNKVSEFFHSKKWKNIFDKFTTGLLILLMASPIAILAYIIVWFINK